MFRGDVDGKVPTFQRIGLKGSNFFMRDLETDSHWQQLTGECFEGPMKGKSLARIPFLLTTWAEWRKRQMDTLVLVPEPAYKANYEVMAKRNTNLPPSSQPGRGALREDSRLPPHDQVMGIEIGGAHKAYPVALLRTHPVLNDQTGSTPVLVVYNAAAQTTTVFSRVLKDRILTFQAAQQAAMDMLVDNETHSKWTYYGNCTSGKLKGQKLELIVPTQSFWFAWVEFFPDTEIYSVR